MTHSQPIRTFLPNHPLLGDLSRPRPIDPMSHATCGTLCLLPLDPLPSRERRRLPLPFSPSPSADPGQCRRLSHLAGRSLSRRPNPLPSSPSTCHPPVCHTLQSRGP